MILKPGVKLEAVLAASAASSQPGVQVDFFDYFADGQATPPAMYRTPLSHLTDVTILAAPTNPVREVTQINIFNNDSATATVTVKTDDGTTESILVRYALPTLKTLTWNQSSGWQAAP